MKSEAESESDSEFPAAAALSGADSLPGEASAWLRLAAARRRALAAREAEHPEPPASPPLGFAVRVAALAMTRRREAALSRWTLWSLRGALASMAAAGALAVTDRPPPPVPGNTSLLRAPALKIPALGPL